MMQIDFSIMCSRKDNQREVGVVLYSLCCCKRTWIFVNKIIRETVSRTDIPLSWLHMWVSLAVSSCRHQIEEWAIEAAHRFRWLGESWHQFKSGPISPGGDEGDKNTPVFRWVWRSFGSGYFWSVKSKLVFCCSHLGVPCDCHFCQLLGHLQGWVSGECARSVQLRGALFWQLRFSAVVLLALYQTDGPSVFPLELCSSIHWGLRKKWGQFYFCWWVSLTW